MCLLISIHFVIKFYKLVNHLYYDCQLITYIYFTSIDTSPRKCLVMSMYKPQSILVYV